MYLNCLADLPTPYRLFYPKQHFVSDNATFWCMRVRRLWKIKYVYRQWHWNKRHLDVDVLASRRSINAVTMVLLRCANRGRPARRNPCNEKGVNLTSVYTLTHSRETRKEEEKQGILARHQILSRV
ncbi:unnamed protein product [Ixodes persulcatus]